MNISTKVGIAAVGCVFLASVSYAADLAIPSVRDNTLYQGQADGGPPDGERSNAKGPNLWSGKGSNGNLKRSALFFDCASVIPAEATITSAVLVLTLDRAQPNVGPTKINIHRLVDDWGEGTSDASFVDGGGRGTNATTGDMTFTHTFFPGSLWVTAGGEFVAQASAGAAAKWPAFSDGPPYRPTNHLFSGGGDSTSLLLEDDIQKFVDGVYPEYGWILVGDETQQPTSKRYMSREATEENQRPILLVGFNTLTTTTSTTTLPLRFEDTGDNLVGYWPGDNTTADDQSLFNNDGTFAGNAGTATNIPPCLFANQTNSFAFDGSGDWITIGNVGFPGGPNPNLSIAFWVNIQSRPDNPGDIEYFFGMGNIAGANRRTQIGGRNEGDVFIEHGGASVNWTASATLLPLNEWTHVAYTASNGTDRIYTNGTLSDIHAPGFLLINQVGRGRMGSAITGNPAGDLEMDGYIDEPAVFGRTLTSAEIAKLHFGTTTTTTSTSSTLTSTTSTTSITSTTSTTSSTTTSPFVNAIPYAEPFEAMPPYAHGFAIDGTNGWIGKDDAAVISTNEELNAAIETDLALDNVPVGIPGLHMRVLSITPDKVEIAKPREAMKIASKVNGNTSTVFSDFLWQPRRGAEPRTVTTNAQLAFYPHYNGKIIIYHDDSGPEWHPLTNSPVLSTGTWARVTVEQNFTGKRWRLRINGQEHISDPVGWSAATGGTQPGSWVDMVSKGSAMSKIEFEGEGYTDDLIVQTGNTFQDALLLIIR